MSQTNAMQPVAAQQQAQTVVEEQQLPTIASALESLTSTKDAVQVQVSTQVIHLLSDQLYQSPLKAVEELVINSYDADAPTCRVYVPNVGENKDYVLICDDGKGMNYEELVNLWQIGDSNKRTEAIAKRAVRKQIGKFGIGKLATATIAHKLTYISKSSGEILSVTVDYRQFTNSVGGKVKNVELPVKEIGDWKSFVISSDLSSRFSEMGIEAQSLANKDSWTIAILEELKPKAQNLKTGELAWILRTAMPLQTDFKLYLNSVEVISSKEDYEKKVDFSVHEISKTRLDGLKSKYGEEWIVDGKALKSASFPAGVTGNVIMTGRMLAGKSDDLQRSRGFFVKVRGRLINEEDELFGIEALTHGVFGRFRADVNADDLDDSLKASREALEESKLKIAFRALLKELYNEASTRLTAYDKAKGEKDNPKVEGKRNVVRPDLVEYPVADVLAVQLAKKEKTGSEANNDWFYLGLEDSTDVKGLINSLYTEKRNNYKYQIKQGGKSERMAKFDPVSSVFWLNSDHEFVKEYITESKGLLEDTVTAEVLLEVYLKEAGINADIVGGILEKRDSLFRTLAKDRMHSPKSISQALIDAFADKYELEIALVVAARALGFIATQVSGAGEPDGIAKYVNARNEKIQITLEAKSSTGTPTLAAIDFAGLEEHTLAKASSSRDASQGCLLLAPSYPGDEDAEWSAAKARAQKARISCWTIEQLARVVAAAEERHFNAEHILDIVLKHHSPADVANAVDELLKAPEWNNVELYEAILDAMHQLSVSLVDNMQINLYMIWTIIRFNPNFSTISDKDIDKALRDLASASQGGMTLREQIVIPHVSIQELRNRLYSLAKISVQPRRLSNFKSNE